MALKSLILMLLEVKIHHQQQVFFESKMSHGVGVGAAAGGGLWGRLQGAGGIKVPIKYDVLFEWPPRVNLRACECKRELKANCFNLID